MRVWHFQARELIGKTVGIAGEHLTGAQMTEALSQKVNYYAVPFDVYREFGFPGDFCGLTGAKQ